MGNLLRPGCVLVLLSALQSFAISSTSAQRYDDKAISPAYMISKKTCYAKGQSGTCMFVWECMKTEGNAIGMCVEGFMFGSCCSHDIDNNLVPNKRPTLPPVVKPATLAASILPTSSSSNAATETSSTISTTQSNTPPVWLYPTTSSSINTITEQETALATTSTTTVPTTSPSTTTAEPVSKETWTKSSTTSTTTLPTTSVSPNAGSPTVTSSTSPRPTKNRTKPSRRPTTQKPSTVTTIHTGTTPLDRNNVTAEVPIPSTAKPSSPSTTNTTFVSSTTPSTTTVPITPSTTTTTSTTTSSSPTPTTSIPTTTTTSTTAAPSSPIPTSSIPTTTSTSSTSTSTTSPTTMTTTTPTTTATSTTATSTATPTSASHSSAVVFTTQPTVDGNLFTQNPFNNTLSSTSSNNSVSTSTVGDVNSSSTSRPPITVTSLPISNPSIECGIPPLFARQEGTARIVGGTNAKFGSWPWQVSVRRTSFFGFSSTHRCGGALLNELWVVTAGHCVEDLLVTQIRLRLGEFDFSSVQEPFPFVERGVNKKVVHPKYNFFTYEYDLALVRLEEPVEFMPNIAPICLPATDDLLIGENGTVTGWGRLSEGGTLPSMLQQVTVPIVSNDKCKDMFLRAGRNEYIPEIFMCAGYEQGGRDSCQGDSGGPLQVRGRDGRYFLAGIISWGIGCAEANLPGVCTRISKFTNWILENVT